MDEEKRSDWKERILTREDIGYGPPRPYEYGPEMPPPRERRTRDRRAEPAPPEDESRGPYASRLQRRRRPDLWVEADVEESLFFDTWVDADRITTVVQEGVVTLLGTLPNAGEIRRALATVSSVPGVVAVRNRLERET